MPKKRPAIDPVDEAKRKAAQSHREKMAAKSRGEYDAVAEIGPIGPAKHPDRRERCRLDLHAFLVEYFPGTTGLAPFSEDHKRVIARLQESALKGGRFYNLVYRGFAKTTISVNTALWAMLYGHRRFVLLVAATRQDALDLLDAIRAELEVNERLAEDFPEVCQAIEALEGKPQRCGSQTCEGELTRIEWKKDKIVLPTITQSGKLSAASGATVMARGITGAIRGRGKRRTDGTQQRPDWVIVDDPQTDASASSPGQVLRRLGVLSKTILKLAGHNSTLACIVNGTIIEPDDFMDRLRDPNQYPGWQGETVKMVRQWSDAHETLWLGEYARIRRGFDPSQPGDKERAHAAATAFYRANRAAMDAGCLVSWLACFDPENELSAIQHAYNFLIDDGEDVFSAECQSEPARQDAEAEQLTLAEVVTKLSGLKCREVPSTAVKIVAFCDVQHESLWWVVVAWTADFTGYVIDYGVWPEPSRLDGVSKSKLRKTLTKQYPDQRDPAVRIRCGLDDLAAKLLDRSWLDVDGRDHRISLLFVDQKEGQFSKSIRAWAKSCRWSSIVRPYGGLGIGPAEEPLPNRKKKDGTVRQDLYLVEEKDRSVKGGTIVSVDKYWWSSFAAARWRAGSPRPKNDPALRPCEPGALYLWGTDPLIHSTFGAHQVSEYSTAISHPKSGRTVQIWKPRPGAPDNDWWDGLVGCCAAAAYAGGISLKDSGLSVAPSRKRKRYTRDELRAMKDKQNG